MLVLFFAQGAKAYFAWVVFRALFETLSSSPDITQTFVVGAMEWLRGWMYQRYCGG